MGRGALGQVRAKSLALTDHVTGLDRSGSYGDIWTPDVLRLGVAPLYLRHVDVWDAMAVLGDVLATGANDPPYIRGNDAVT
ncbi:MAG: hypothetical protein M3137_14975 [Actinomycetota bacterium]|nr:hypothetical protein [Actinomycetota bacterium]